MNKLPVPEVGTKAPDFSALNQRGETVKLSDLKGKKVVLYFYPKDNTPGCTKEACSLRDHHEEIESRDAVVLGVSRDSQKSHQNFIEKFDLPFDLLIDSDLSIHKAYGAWGEKNMYGKISEGVLRYTFVIDKDGLISKVFKKVATATHGEDVLDYI